MKYILITMAAISLCSGISFMIGRNYRPQPLPLAEVAVHADDLQKVLCMDDFGNAETFYAPKGLTGIDSCSY